MRNPELNTPTIATELRPGIRYRLNSLGVDDEVTWIERPAIENTGFVPKPEHPIVKHL